jgi:GNAT superfamily N-acetyltransferase
VDPQVRLATAADVQQIAELQVEAWQEAYRGLLPAAFLSQQDPQQRAQQWASSLGNASYSLLVAVSGVRVYGFCALTPSRDPDPEPNTGEVAAIYVHPLAWRKGYGRGLLEAAVRIAREKGYVRITLWVLDTNDMARRFYEANGFRVDGHTKNEPVQGGSLPHVRYVRDVPAA